MRHYIRKTGWLLLGLFAPEMVVYAAWSQYKSASLLTNAMNEFFEETHQPRKHTWTTVHSFYACMGGFVMDTADPFRETYVRDLPRASLGCRGVLFAVRHGGYIPDMSKADILDRSKADNLGKCLVCLQAGWAVVQCISRLVSHLPLTLLEVNTLGHVLCALLMYLFWLQKPLDVNEPTVLQGEWTRPMCAWLLISNSLSVGLKKRSMELSGLCVYPGDIREASHLTSCSPELTPDSASDGARKSITRSRPNTVTSESSLKNIIVRAEKHIQPSLEDPNPSLICLQENEILSGTMFGPRPNAKPRRGDLITAVLPPRTVSLDRVAITRWRLASVFVSEHPNVLGIDPIRGPPEEPLVFHGIEFAGLLMIEVPDWPGLDQLHGHTTFAFAKLCAATTLYGGLHVGAWNSTFPSASEGLLWKMSSVLITGSGLAASAIAVFRHWKSQDKWKQALRSYAHRYLSISSKVERVMIIGFGEFTFWAYSMAIVAIVPTLVIARLYLVVEAFISLRGLPIEAYQTPAWTQWIPHL